MDKIIKAKGLLNIRKYIFDQTNFSGDKIEPSIRFYIETRSKDGEIDEDNYIAIKESKEPFVYINDYSGVFDDLNTKFETGIEFNIEEIYDRIENIEKVYNIKFRSFGIFD